MLINDFDFSKVNTVIFDMDGVLLNSERSNFIRWMNAGKDLGLPSYEVTALWNRCLGVTEKYEKHLITKSHISYEEFMAAINRYSTERFTSVFNDAIALLNMLKLRNIQMGLASSSKFEKINEALLGNHIKPFFKQVFSGESLLSKPSPEIYLRTIEAMNADPNTTIIIEDSQNGIKAALDSKVYAVIAMEDTQRHFIYINNPRVYVAKSLSEVINQIKMTR